MKTTGPGSCRNETLARGPACKIDLCGCGTLHVSIGVLTVRLERDVFESVCETLVRALQTLRLRNARPGHGHRLC